MPILLVVCASATGAFAAQTDGAARMLALIGVGLLVAILVSSLIVAEPVNSKFRKRSEGVIPPDAERLRRLWRGFHLIRTAIALAAWGCLVTAVTYA